MYIPVHVHKKSSVQCQKKEALDSCFGVLAFISMVQHNLSLIYGMEWMVLFHKTHRAAGFARDHGYCHIATSKMVAPNSDVFGFYASSWPSNLQAPHY